MQRGSSYCPRDRQEGGHPLHTFQLRANKEETIKSECFSSPQTLPSHLLKENPYNPAINIAQVPQGDTGVTVMMFSEGKLDDLEHATPAEKS